MKAVLVSFLTFILLTGVSAPVTAEQQANLIRALGTVELREIADVAAPSTGGRVTQLGVDQQDHAKTIDYGSRIKKNDVLAQLDPTADAAVVERAKANLRYAAATYDLAKLQLALAQIESQRPPNGEAKKTGETTNLKNAELNIAQAKVRVAEAAIETAKAELQIARIRLDQFTIRSPMDGIVIDRRINIGQSTTPSQSLFLIGSDLEKLQVWASVSEADVVGVAVAQPVQFTVAAFPNRQYTGRVSQIRLNAQMTKNIVQYTVVIDIDEAKGLLPYQTADVRIKAAKSK